MDVIIIIGILFSLFYFVLLLSNKSKTLPESILTMWMASISIHLFSYYLFQQGYWKVYPHLIGITAPLPLIYGPFLYLYIWHSLKNETHLSQKDYLHFLPVILSYLYMSRFYFFYTAAEKRLMDTEEIDDFGNFAILLLIAVIVSGITYSAYSYQLLNRYKRLLDNNFSNTEKIDLNWLKGFIWGVGLIFLTLLVVIVTRDLIGLTYPFNSDYIIYSMFVFAILALGYFGIRHQNIFVDNVIVEVEPEEKEAYKKSGLKEEVAKSMYDNLLEVMANQKPYLESKLSLYSLAQILSITPNHLSQIINQFEKHNFNDFVNKYRIEEFINKASKNTHYTFLALALESGFNSKSTFNAVFKKHKGLTPSQFMASTRAKMSA